MIRQSAAIADGTCFNREYVPVQAFKIEEALRTLLISKRGNGVLQKGDLYERKR